VNLADLLPHFRRAGLIETDDVRFIPLGGGVSSDIHLVETMPTGRRFVVKAALAKLRVKDDWFADVSRNAVEQRYLSYAARVVPQAVPRVLASDATSGWFAMEHFGDGFSPWKEQLMAGDAQPETSRRVGHVLGQLHRVSWGDREAREQFATLRNFRALRIEPYLVTTAQRVPTARTILLAEADRLAATELALVHGDFSPKNLLVNSERLIVLDAECGWFGDPAFDSAFLLTHLYLKGLQHADLPDPLLALVPEFWSAYTEALGSHADAALESRTVRLLDCLLLARVHGKSPVEYLTTEAQRDCVTSFALRTLAAPAGNLAESTAAWRDAILQSR
jgi:aminoglycoside phosphotransferase (APT) family kinase protein